MHICIYIYIYTHTYVDPRRPVDEGGELADRRAGRHEDRARAALLSTTIIIITIIRRNNNNDNNDDDDNKIIITITIIITISIIKKTRIGPAPRSFQAAPLDALNKMWFQLQWLLIIITIIIMTIMIIMILLLLLIIIIIMIVIIIIINNVAALLRAPARLSRLLLGGRHLVVAADLHTLYYILYTTRYRL